MYYHDSYFNGVNTHMHISLKTKSCNGGSMKMCFKVDTGADGNLLPLGEFFKHFPEANLNDLAKKIDPYTQLYAYNNTEIKQLGVCELLVEYKSNSRISKFYVVDFPTAILGIHDITVHFDAIDAETSQTESVPRSTTMYVNAIQGDDDEFTVEIKCECKDLFTSIGNIHTTTDIKLRDDAVPYVAPIRRVAHALQEPLRLELEKLVDEGILRKLKIDEKSIRMVELICMCV